MKGRIQIIYEAFYDKEEEEWIHIYPYKLIEEDNGDTVKTILPVDLEDKNYDMINTIINNLGKKR